MGGRLTYFEWTALAFSRTKKSWVYWVFTNTTSLNSLTNIRVHLNFLYNHTPTIRRTNQRCYIGMQCL